MKKYAVLCLMVLLLGTAFLGTSKADGGTTTENGFTWDENGVLTSYAYNGSNNVVVIPSNITAIGFNAFAGKSITEVTIPASVTSIDQQAFISCSQLKKVTFSDISESKLTTIGDRAFLGCASLESLTFPSSVTDMGATVFQGCASLKSVSFPKNLKSFDINSYRNCTALTEVIIPDCVTVITEYCFDQCSSLVSLNIPDSVTTIEPFALCGSRTPALKKVTIGAGVTKIGGNAFNECSNLTSVTFATPGADCTLGDNCFSGCSALSSITLPGRVTSIGVDCFIYDSSLASVTLGEGLKNIGTQAFYYVSSLKEITIPKTVTSIGYSAFTRCDSLEKVVLEEGVTGFYEYSFSYCNALKEINIPGSMKNIGSNMFSSCSSLQKVTLGEGVESIGAGAFSNCFELVNVTLPSTLTDFDKEVFRGCEKIDGFYVSEGEGNFRGTKDGKALMDGSTLVWLASDTTPIPASADTIGNRVFSRHEQLRSLVLPENIKYLADEAFLGCVQLESINLPSRLIKIGEGAFGGCTKLNHLVIPAAVSEIGVDAFNSCTSLRDFSVAEANPYYSFESKALVDLRNGTLLWGDLATEIPSNVRIIAKGAFDAADTHKALLLPDGVLTICENAFYCCKKLETVMIPDTVTSIAENAFFICSNLQYVSIPEGVTKLNQEIFSYCSNLECVAFPKNDIEIKSWYKNECNEQNFRMMVYPNTAAEQYAKENNCKYEYYYNGEAKVSFTGNLLSLEENYILYVYTDYADGNTTIPNGISARVTYPDGKITSNILPTKKGNLKRNDPASGTVYPFGIPFAAKEINDEVVVQVFQNGTDIPLSDPITVSVAKYCNDLCRLDTTTEEQKNLVQKLLTFATYSQLFFGYKTDKLAKPVAECNLSNTEDILANLSECPEEPGFIGPNYYVNSIFVYGTSLILDSTIVYRVYITTDNANTPSHCGMDAVIDEDALYYKDIPVPLITQLGDDLNVRMNDVYVVGKPIAYIKATLSKTTDESLKNICIALYDYYMAAKAYQQ